MGNASPVGTRSASLSVQDRVILHLQEFKLITWHEKGKGRYADIDEITYNSALIAIGEGPHHNTTTRDTKRATHGTDENYAVTNTECFNSGGIAVDNTITSFAIVACDALLDNTVPTSLLNGVRLYQSAGVTGAEGLSEYILYGFKNLVSGSSNPAPSVCQGAFDLFNANYCQTKNNAGWSQGGKLSIGNNWMFSVNPTDVFNGQ